MGPADGILDVWKLSQQTHACNQRSPDRVDEDIADGNDDAGAHHILDPPETAGIGSVAGRINGDQEQHASGHADGQAHHDGIQAQIQRQCANHGQAQASQGNALRHGIVSDHHHQVDDQQQD